MSDHEVRIAIAEACGWRFHPDGCGFIQPGGNDWIGRGYRTLSECCPDYINDLNAIAIARRSLTEAQRRVFGEQLCRVVQRRRKNPWCVFILYTKHPWTGEDVFDLVDSTAAEQAEAFLRTINKWKEETAE